MISSPKIKERKLEIVVFPEEHRPSIAITIILFSLSNLDTYSITEEILFRISSA